MLHLVNITQGYQKSKHGGGGVGGISSHWDTLGSTHCPEMDGAPRVGLSCGLIARAILPADRFEEPVIIHPVFLWLVAQNGNPAGTDKGQLKNLPLLVRNLPLLGTNAAFLPQNGYRATISNRNGAETRDAPKMPVKIGSRLCSAAGFQLV